MANAPATREDTRTPVQRLIDNVRSPDFQRQIAVALPEGTTAERFLRIAATALLENPDIVEAQPDSIFASLLKAAGDGLLPNGDEAALVLFNTKRKGKVAQYLPMIGGYRKIAAEHGWAIETVVVYEADDFTYELGLEPQLDHKPAPLGVDRGKIVAAYAIGRELATGAKVFEVMTAEDIAKVRKTARSQEIWNAWEERMSAKTVGRRLFKSLPLGDRDRVRKVLAADELEPAEATDLVYGTQELPATTDAGSREDDSAEERQTPAPTTPEPSQQEGGEEAPSVAQAPPPPFHGEEPKAPAVDTRAADVIVPEWSERYGGQTLGDVALAGDRVYLEWLASEAVTDEELRAAAGKVLEALES